MYISPTLSTLSTLSTGPRISFFFKIQHEMTKMRSKKGAPKKYDFKIDFINGRHEMTFFSLYLLQLKNFKRFSWSRKFIDNGC